MGSSNVQHFNAVQSLLELDKGHMTIQRHRNQMVTCSQVNVTDDMRKNSDVIIVIKVKVNFFLYHLFLTALPDTL